MENDGRKRVEVENVKPCVDGGLFPIKRIEGEMLKVSADLLCDSHDSIDGNILYKNQKETEWNISPMHLVVNDRWEGSFHLSEAGEYLYTVRAWVDHFQSWQHILVKKYSASQDISVELLSGVKLFTDALLRIPSEFHPTIESLIEMLQSDKEHSKTVLLATDKEITALMKAYPDLTLALTDPVQYRVIVERKRALFSAWYEVFPRSCSFREEVGGTFRDCEQRLPVIAQMGFDVLYFPPVHPIGWTNRKGKNNSLEVKTEDPGSPWAIGSYDGGHKDVEPSLGTIEDFVNLINAATSYGMEIAMDIAFQCSPDHPYLKTNPEWFKVRADGSIQYAENPPKKYQDIVPFDFETQSWKELWEELKSVLFFWLDKGVRIFRVDNPHTKPFALWEWLIKEVRVSYPDTIFLSEAFTRPKIMYRLAKLGFSQSYTYFTWRNTKEELTQYINELNQAEISDFFRPNFWPTTPDILPQYLQFGDQRAFAVRLVLAATLSSSYGIYGPSFELTENQAFPGKEEYLNSEKYEIKHWDWNKGERIRNLISDLNRIRQLNPAFHDFKNTRFCQVDNDYLLFYMKTMDNISDTFFVIINLDPFHTQSGQMHIPVSELGISRVQSYLLKDQLNGERFVFSGESNCISIDPNKTPAYLFRLYQQVSKETSFDYY